MELKPLSEDQLSYRVQLLNDPAVGSYLNTEEIFTFEKTWEWFQKRNLDKRFDGFFVHDGVVIGMGGLVNVSHRNHNAELYIYLSPEFHGKGLGTESLIKLCKYGFEDMNLHKIYLYTFSGNERANRMYEKVGFVREGFLREHTLKDGVLQDRCLYGLLKTDFFIR